MSDHLVIVFAKTPAPGQVKTRIGATVGMEAAATIYEQMLQTVLKESAPHEDWRRVIAVTPESDLSYFSEPGQTLLSQWGSDIGKRLSHALRFGVQSGADRVIIIGSDIPSLTAADLAEAFARLETEPCVVGPSLDGGFYLIGSAANHAGAVCEALNADIAWSTPQVLHQLQAASRQIGLPLSLLPVKQDIDTYEDWLGYLDTTNKDKPSTPRPVSVIIPALNEEALLGDCLQSLAQEGCEIIVVDGGSADRTPAIAAAFGATVIRLGVANRAKQMNAGAKIAQGELLLFFHADSRLPRGGIAALQKVMAKPHMAGGAFSLRFFPEEPFYSWLAVGANAFCRLTKMMFGDRGMFIRASLFRQIGPFPEQAIMEDAALATAMRKAGDIVILPDAVYTSARKHHKETNLQAVYRTLWAYAAYRLGVSPEKIKARYYGLAK